MTVKEAVKKIDEADQMIKTIDALLDVLGTDDYEEKISITQEMAFVMVDICQEYKDMVLGSDVEIKSAAVQEELPFN